MRLESSGGYDDPPERDKPAVHDKPRETGRPREAVEGTGWPADLKPEKPKTPQERIDGLEKENARLSASYEKTLKENAGNRHKIAAMETDIRVLRRDNSRLVETNSNLVHDNAALHRKLEAAPAVTEKAHSRAERDELAEKKPHRHNWFPTDKMGAVGGAVAGVAGTYGELAGRVSSKEEAFGVACAGAGIAVVGLGREMMDKVNDWRNERAEKKAEKNG